MACEDPEPYYNKEAAPPEEHSWVVSGITEGQHLAGTVQLTFEPDFPVDEIAYVELMVDEQAVYGISTPPFEFLVDTRQWPDGGHDLTIGVHEINPPDMGLLNLANIPSKMYTTSVYFDQTPPTPVVIESVLWNEAMQTPEVTWQKNNDANFYSYTIQWIVNGYYYDSGPIYDQNVTSYANPALNNGAIGFDCSYRVFVYNRDQTAVTDWISFSYPESLQPIDVSIGGKRPILSKSGNELFTLDNDGVKAFSLVTNTVVRSYDMSYKYPMGFALSKDGTKLYVLASNPSFIVVLNASDFEVIQSTELEFTGMNIICGRPDRLYVSTYSPYDGPLKILDAFTLSVVGSLDIGAPNGLLEISPDNNILYIADPSYAQYTDASVSAVDVSTDEPEILYQRAGFANKVRDIKISDDGATLFVVHDYDWPTPSNKFVDCWNANTLLSYKNLPVPDLPFNITVQGSSLFAAYGVGEYNHYDPGGIIQYETTGGTVMKDWKFMRAPYACEKAGAYNRLYVFGDKTWIVPLHNN